jgi:signal transduction histidine kinase/CheY-like chemotaxis protein
MGWNMLQDAEGTLYFGCNALVVYDGDRWRANPISGAYALRGIDFGKDGRIWAAAAGEIGWFEHTESGIWKFHSLLSHLPKEHAIVGEVWHAWEDGDGAVFVSADKVFRWDGKQFHIWPFSPKQRLTSMRVGGIIYVSDSSTGLYELRPKGLKPFISGEILEHGTVFWMERQKQGWLLATSKGLFHYTLGKLEPIAPDASEFIRVKLITCATRLPDGRLAVGTFAGGIMFLNTDYSVQSFLNEKSGLPTSAIFSLNVDRDGALWCTSNTHIFRVAIESNSRLFDQRSGLPAKIGSTVMRSEGRISVTSGTGLYALQADEKTFTSVKDLPGIYSNILQTNNALLLGTSFLIKKYSNDRITTLYSASEDIFLVKSSQQWPGHILISEGHSVALINDAGVKRVLVQKTPDIITSIAEGVDHRLWLGTSTRGVLVAQPTESNPVEAIPPPLTNGLIEPKEHTVVTAAPDGSILLFGQNNGWILGRNAKSFEPIQNYPKRGVTTTSEVNSEGVMWIAYSESDIRAACVARISISGNHAIWEPHTVEGLDLIGTLCSIYAEPSPTHGTNLWVGGTSGVVRNEVKAGPVATRPRAPLLHALARSSEKNDLESITQSLPYSTRTILFEFASPEYALRPSLRLETRIDGIDDRWVQADAKSRRELTAVRDGSYTFHVRAVASSGMVSETTSFSFTVMPPWWRTAPALAGAFFLLLPLGYGAYWLRVRVLQRRNAELEDKVSQRTEQLAQASAAKTQFVANMSHDIRNPLNGIVGLALALEDTRLDDKQREMVAILRECTTYLSTLVDDVLDFASIEAGRVELRPDPFSPAELLRSVVTTLRAEAADRGATLTVETDPDLPVSLLGDAGRIQQILVNYVGNALKYAGGNIRLSASAPADSQGEVEFAVTDDGAGISEEEQAALFTKFHRLAGAQQSDIKGSGLGLASCRLLADLMGGSVGVTSSRGHGARFHLRLPLTVASATVPVVHDDLPSTSVLLVEDADYNAWAASAVLAKLGLTCERARTGAEAIKLFAEKRFNLVLLDRNLPDMDGTEVARQIRLLEDDGPRSILLAVTAYCTPEDRALCLEAGMDAFVGKPLTPDKLRKILIAAGRRLLTAASMHVSPGATSPVIDVSLLDYISDGTQAGLNEQVERFLEALTEGEARLTQATRARDFITLGDAAHFVLSQARLVGSATLEDAAISLETAARARDGMAFGEPWQRVQREVLILRAAMRRSRLVKQTV